MHLKLLFFYSMPETLLDQMIVESVEGIDMIIGEHSHTKIDDLTYHE